MYLLRKQLDYKVVILYSVVSCSKSNFTVRKAALPRYHMHRGGGVCKCVGYDELQMCLLDYRHVLSKCRAAERRETLLMALMYCHHTHYSYVWNRILSHYSYYFCSIQYVNCGQYVNFQFSWDIQMTLNLPKYTAYSLSTHCMENCMPDCKVQLT